MPTSSSEVAISVRDLGKRYRLGEQNVFHGSLRDAFADAASRALHRARGKRAVREDFWALDHVSFDVERGHVLGIIGRNGAGKTTLLKLLSGITDPTTGEAHIWGRVGSLLEVGTGFHGDLTGRENIFLNGAILGMRKREIERKFDEIVGFAEVERFIDTPVKRYSSGMYLRLAFAVAAHLEPEILIVDEVLAVGDAAFQRKCLGKMGEVSGEGRTVLLVSHNMSAISSLAKSCLWLDGGKVRALGTPDTVVADYLSGDLRAGEAGYADLSDPSLREGVPKQTAGEVMFDWLQLRHDDGAASDIFFEDEPLTVELGLQAKAPTTRLEILCHVRTLEGVLVFTLTSGVMEVEFGPGPAEVAVTVPRNNLRPGRYAIDLYMLTGLAQDYLLSAAVFEVAGSRGPLRDPRHARNDLGLVNVEQEWGEVRSGSGDRVSR